MAVKNLGGANQVWQRARIILENSSPAMTGLFKALKIWLATQKGNPRLQFVTFSDVTTAQPTELTEGGATLYALYVKKGDTDTDAFVKVGDSATLAGGAAGINTVVTVPLYNAKDEMAMFFQPGIPFTTGITVASETTAAGGTNSEAGDGPSGFYIIG